MSKVIKNNMSPKQNTIYIYTYYIDMYIYIYIQIKSKIPKNMGFHHSILVTHPFPNINHIQTPPPTCSHHHRPTRLTGAKKKRSRKGGHHLTLEPFSLKKNPWKELTCRKSLAGWKDSPKKKAFLMPIDYPLFLVTNS